jgi:ADP-ribosylation factor-like protein 8
MGGLYSRLRNLFFSRTLELVLVGLANSGKTTFCNFLHTGRFVEEGPTIGLNVKVMQKGGVTTKIWDLGGQAKYRTEWSRYTRGCDVIVFVVDTTAPNELPTAKKELHQLLEDRDLARLPLLVLANKIDLGPKVTEPELIKGLNLDYITENPWLIIPVSAKDGTNVEQVRERTSTNNGGAVCAAEQVLSELLCDVFAGAGLSAQAIARLSPSSPHSSRAPHRSTYSHLLHSHIRVHLPAQTHCSTRRRGCSPERFRAVRGPVRD